MRTSLCSMLLLITLSLVSYSQSTAPLTISLQDAIETGLKNRTDLKNQQLQIKIAQNDLQKQNDRNLPQVTATADFRYNTTLQTNILPGSVFGVPGSPDKAVKFGLPYNNNLALNLKQNIYDPGVQYDRKISRVSVQSEDLKLEQNKIDAKLTIAQAYYQVLLAGEKLKLSRSERSRNQSNLAAAYSKSANKNLTSNDLDRFSLDYRNSRVSVQKDSTELELAALSLLNEMGLPLETSITLADSLNAFNDVPEGLEGDGNLQNRVEIREENVLKEVNELNEQKQSMSRLPTVQLYGNNTFQELSQNFGLFNVNNWYPYNYVGLQVNLPVFDGYQKTRTRTEYGLRKEINKNNLEKIHRDVKYEYETAKTALLNTSDNLHYARLNYQQAKDLVNVYQVRFREGNAVQSDILNSEYSLRTAQVNLINAYYDYLLAKLKWLKAKGEL